jgi:hypothetical protein
MSRLETRVTKLELANPDRAMLTCALVRYHPGSEANWLPGLIERLGWSPSLHTLLTIEGSSAHTDRPEVIIPPLALEEMTAAQSATLSQAGKARGLWWIAVAGRGWLKPLEAFAGEAALMAELRAMRGGNLGWDND